MSAGLSVSVSEYHETGRSKAEVSRLNSGKAEGPGAKSIARSGALTDECSLARRSSADEQRREKKGCSLVKTSVIEFLLRKRSGSLCR